MSEIKGQRSENRGGCALNRTVYNESSGETEVGREPHTAARQELHRCFQMGYNLQDRHVDIAGNLSVVIVRNSVVFLKRQIFLHTP